MTQVAKMVLSKVIRLFNRYCDHNFAVHAPGFPVFDASGRKLGHVERVCFGRHSARLEGWCVSEQISFGQAGRQNWQKPDILRPDVNAALGLPTSTRTGFNLPWVGETRNLFLSLKMGKETLQIMCPEVGKLQRTKAQIHIRVSFAKALIRAAPALCRAVVAPSVLSRLRAKRALGLEAPYVNHVLDARVFDKGRRYTKRQKLTLVMPVFNAFDVLQNALMRIVENTDVCWRLILVEDCSTDPRIRPMLRAWGAEKIKAGFEVELLENDSNLGFIGSINRAFKKALQYQDHVVIINSDALVPKNWAQRLLTPILLNRRVASVTPLSNDAEIFTAPISCQPNAIADNVADQIDRVLGENISSLAHHVAPTGVGFCMAINIHFLRKLPEFDPVFGKGYGEEVDWCQKVIALGGVHMCQPNLFVEHRGGASFGGDQKCTAIAKNNIIVSNRYPTFDMAVQRFIADDPLRTPRLFAAIAKLASSQTNTTIFIAHSLGGGAEFYLKEKLAKITDEGQGAIVLRVGGLLRWRLEVHSPEGTSYGETDDTKLIHRMLSPLKARTLIYSCAVGDLDPMGLVRELCALASVKKTTLEFLVHDYFAISPSYCLLNSDNRYQGIPKGDLLDHCHSHRGKAGEFVTNDMWRERWRGLLKMSHQVVCFSQNSAGLIKEAFPDLQTLIKVEPHSVSPVRRARVARTSPKFTIGVLGDIGVQKGAKVLSECSKYLLASEVENMVIVGRVDPQFSLGSQFIETGSYARSEIPALAERHGIQAWLIPSIWPETFSYTTHEALATGLPVLAFDIGAQGDAVRRAQNGHTLPIGLCDDPQKLLFHIQEVLAHGSARRRSYSRLKSRRNRGFAA